MSQKSSSPEAPDLLMEHGWEQKDTTEISALFRSTGFLLTVQFGVLYFLSFDQDNNHGLKCDKAFSRQEMENFCSLHFNTELDLNPGLKNRICEIIISKMKMRM